tara:strand:- start:3987 stop:4490 length:504 start_codon:yes stop_codon:yes gene_type:complete
MKRVVMGISLIRIVIAVLVLFFYQNIWFLSVILVIAGITDLLDGYLARKFNVASDLGGFIDGISDKVLIFVLAILLFYTREIHIGYLFLFLIRDIYVLVAVTWLYVFKTKDVNVASTSHVMGKISTVFQYIILLLFVFEQIRVGLYLMVLLVIFSVLTIYQYHKRFP